VVFAINRITRRLSGCPVFCFWEPADKIPPYVRLCMETWRTVSNIEVHLLDYATMGRFFKNPFSDNLYKLSLPQQADAIRFGLLAKNAGVWMDVDTIITRDPTRVWRAIYANDCVLFGGTGKVKTGIISARKARMSLFCEILEDVTRLINAHPPPPSPPWHYILDPFYARIEPQNFCGNSVEILDAVGEGVFPEASVGPGYGADPYREFYFKRPGGFRPSMVKASCGIIHLHNSWTPSAYRKKSANYILYEGDELLSQLIRFALLRQIKLGR
jgi:Capsular polysaccharide synthesis protein